MAHSLTSLTLALVQKILTETTIQKLDQDHGCKTAISCRQGFSFISGKHAQGLHQSKKLQSIPFSRLALSLGPQTTLKYNSKRKQHKSISIFASVSISILFSVAVFVLVFVLAFVLGLDTGMDGYIPSFEGTIPLIKFHLSSKPSISLTGLQEALKSNNKATPKCLFCKMTRMLLVSQAPGSLPLS